MPLAVDLYCGLGGWTAGLMAEGWRTRGYDIEAHEYDGERYPGELVLRNILDMHGSEIADADLIVSSSPCTEYSYMAMPWSRAKAKAAAIRADETGELLRQLNALFDAQFRLQREANEIRAAMGLPPIPMIVENVRGAQEWVGRARANYGSYYLWGDVPALMPSVRGGGGRARQKSHPGEQWNVNRKNFTGTLGRDQSEREDDGRKNPGFRFDGSGRSFQTESVDRHLKAPGGAHIRDGAPHTARLTNPAEGRGGMRPPARVSDLPPADGRKGAGAGAEWFDQNISSLPSGSKRRKAASAKIAKIPFVLSSYVGRVFKPMEET